MNRREFLASGTALCGLLPLANPNLATAEPLGVSPHLPPRIIDVHCHVFNADDLPIEGFLKKVVIPGNAELNKHFKSHQKAFVVLIHTLAKLMKDHAPSVSDEIKLLDGIEHRTASAPSPAVTRAREVSLITVALDKIWDKSAVKDLRGQGAAFPADIALRELQKLILAEVYSDFFCCGATGADIDNVNRADVAERLYRSNKTIGRNLRWGLLFIRNRFELADQLHQMHRERTVLMTPALVDFSMWVEDDQHTPLEQQIDVMERISRRGSAGRVHGFVAFDPLRQAIHDRIGAPESTSPLALVKRAIEQNGFIGVKLYPPMGFRPANNTGIGTDFPDYVKNGRTGHSREALGANPGRALDSAMTKLFAWCHANEVPIMAHTVNSNAAGERYGTRANPLHWESVLAEFPKLRVNLAHFGGFREVGNSKQRENSWEWRIARMWKRAPSSHVYADVSYLSEILSEPAKRNDALNHLKALRDAFAESTDHILYGTDWSMIGREKGVAPIDLEAHRRYPELIADYLYAAKFSDQQIANIMFHNSIRFLGLGADQRAAGTRGRLERFYASKGMETAWMGVFDQRVSAN